ncbi:MAG: hypothetical protein PUA56_00315 [Bacillales bacterium]|nr:hypothetical protein [Bacillales bacterium]
MKMQFNVIIHPFTTIYILLALIFNRFYYFFLFYLLAIIHELCHILVALVFKVKVEEMVLLPFGVYAKMDIMFLSRIKQFLILIAGPLSFFISYFLLHILFKFQVISIYAYKDAMTSNLFIFLFNILPISCLDGGRIINILFDSIFPNYNARIINIALSSLVLVIISSFVITLGQLMISIFLVTQLILSLINLKKDYLKYLIRRIYENHYQDVKVIKNDALYHYKNNIRIKNKCIENEKSIIENYLKSDKK